MPKRKSEPIAATAPQKSRFSRKKLNAFFDSAEKSGRYRSVYNLCRLNGIDTAIYYRLRDGERKNPGAATLAKIARAFTISIDDLMEDDPR